MRSKILIAIGIVCLVISGVWEAKNLSDDYEKKENATKALISVKEQIYNEDNAVDKKILYESSEYCGILEIPSINIELPVTSEYTSELLNNNLCRYYGNVYDGNMVICGHNNRSFLGRLDEVYEGDEIYFIDAIGKKHRYIVVDTSTIDGYNVEEMIEENVNWQMTVFTCNYTGYARNTIRCKEEGPQ